MHSMWKQNKFNMTGGGGVTRANPDCQSRFQDNGYDIFSLVGWDYIYGAQWWGPTFTCNTIHCKWHTGVKCPVLTHKWKQIRKGINPTFVVQMCSYLNICGLLWTEDLAFLYLHFSLDSVRKIQIVQTLQKSSFKLLYRFWLFIFHGLISQTKPVESVIVLFFRKKILNFVQSTVNM